MPTSKSPSTKYDRDAKYGKWPRRLLHVPSLTSYEWKPGNLYAGRLCPAYNTFSYTWGRYALKEGEQPSVTALPIRFEGRRSWKIPRINPANFTVEEFSAALQLATQSYMPVDSHLKTVLSLGLPKEPVEFLWLDVACIDQEHAKTKLSEINRQAIIFQRAQTSCVWMNHMSEEQLISIQAFSRELRPPEAVMPQWPPNPTDDQMGNGNHPAKASLQNWLDRWFQQVQEFSNLLLPEREDGENTTRISAPWFSSLWTLQEAYLRPCARVLPRDCRGVLKQGLAGGSCQMPMLREITLSLGKANSILEECLGLGLGRRDEIEAIMRKISEAGLKELTITSPFAVYSASNRRQTTDPRDRVYGIMQIFGVQLPLQRRGTLYKPAELQQILSEKILLQYPVESQLFVHTEPQAPMTKWRIGTSLVLPSWARALTSHWGGKRGVGIPLHRGRPLPLCKLSVTHGSAYFQGRLCSLRDLVLPFAVLDTFKRYANITPDEEHLPSDHVGTVLNVEVAFDMVPNTRPGSSRLQIPGVPGFLFASVGFDTEDTHKILATMTALDTHGDLHVLLLGSCVDPLNISYWNTLGHGYEFSPAWRKENDEWLVGLILRRTSPFSQGSPDHAASEPYIPSYERVGVCKWFKADCWIKEDGDGDVFVGIEQLTDHMKSVLSGRDKWYEAEGYWG